MLAHAKALIVELSCTANLTADEGVAVLRWTTKRESYALLLPHNVQQFCVLSELQLATFRTR